MRYPPELQALYDKLKYKQKKFVDLWDGKGSSTAEKAKYSGPKCAGARLLKNKNICKLIAYEKDREQEPEILSRKERQKFWSDVVRGNINETRKDQSGRVIERPLRMQDRLKASELLGKSAGDFLLQVDIGLVQEKVEVILAALPDQYAEAIRMKLLKKRLPESDNN
jgi:hypothetical protein